MYLEELAAYQSALAQIFDIGDVSEKYPWMSGFPSRKEYQNWYSKSINQAIVNEWKNLGPIEKEELERMSRKLSSIPMYLPIREEPCQGCFVWSKYHPVTLEIVLPNGRTINIEKNESTNPKYYSTTY